MKKLLFLSILLLTTLSGLAQINGNGFYYVQNYGSKRWAYLRDNYGKLDMGSQQADCGAIQMWKNMPLNDDPSAVIYLQNVSGDHYDLQGQGTGLYKLISHYVQVMDRSKYTKVSNTYWVYASQSGVTKYLDDENTMSGDKGSCGFNSTGNYRLWSVYKIDNADHYLGIRPTVTIGSEQYAPYYVSFAFTKTAGMKVYYVSKVDASRGVAVISEYTDNTVPASMPVFIKCPSASSSSNKITPVVSSIATPTNNLMKGVYFNTPARLNVAKEAAKKFDASTMRILGKTSSGKLGFVNSTSSLTAYKSVYYLNANESYITVSSSAPNELTIVTEAEYEELTSYFTVSVTSAGNGKVSVSPAADKYKKGTSVTATATPNEGYSFASWSNNKTSNPYTFTVNSNVSLTANFKVNQYTITFDTDGGSAVASITQDYGTTIKAPASPTKTGYTFAGWDQTLPSTMPAKNLTLKAKWTVNQYTITFNSNGGSAVSAIKANYGSTVTKPADPTREGYTFTGWNPAIPSTMPAQNMTVTAQWKVNQYTITFDTDGGSAVAAITQDYGTTIKASASPTKTGYTFAGWSQDIPSTMPAKNLTLKAKWTINQYTITFNSNGGSAVSAIKANYNSVISKPANPTREGYTFTGWNPAIPSTMPAENVTVTAQWKVNQYTITFDTDGGSAVASITQDYGTAIKAPTSPTKTGYTFAGWSQDIPSTMPAKNLTLKAKWTINQYTITFNSNGGSAVSAIKANYNSVISKPANPTREGYTFTGWNPAIPSTMPAENVTVIAQWKVNQYTITFDTDGGSAVESITQDYGTSIKAPTSPTKTGYTFAGWSQDIPSTMPAKNLTLKAKWTINQYTITFNSNGGSEVSPIKADYGTAITKPENPTRKGYKFMGWSPAIPSTMPAENVTVTAQWKVKQYTITFDTDGGSTVESMTQDYGSIITAPADPEKTGYTFAGWSQDIPTTMPAKNLTIKATWTANKYNVVFMDGDSVLVSQELEYGSVIESPVDPVREGYTFCGWDPTFVTGATVPLDGITYTAIFKVNPYKVTYLVNDSVYAVVGYSYGDSINVLPMPEKEGYSFSGWGETPEVMPAEDIIITGTFTINQYMVSFVDEEGNLLQGEMQDYGSAIVAPSVEKEGYTFMGWTPDVDEVVPAKDVTYTALYEVNSYKITYLVDDSLFTDEVYNYGDTVNILPEPVKEGYTFSGWSETPETMPAEDITITGTFTINQYMVSFVNEEGNLLQGEKQDYGSAIVAPSVEKEGYTFVGWTPDVDEVVPAKDVTYTAIYEVNTYKVTYMVDGTVYTSEVYNYGDAVSVLPEPVKEGYTFSGWSETLETMPAKDLTVTGTFTINQYLVSFIDEDGTMIQSEKQDYGSAIVAPTAEKEGYTFTGWTPDVDEVVPAKDVTYTATYTVNVYTVSYYFNGTLLYWVEVPYGSAMPTYEWQPEQENIVFNAWVGEEYETMPAHDVVYEADYTDAITLVNEVASVLRIYTINGTYVKTASNLKEANLPSGIYIINGRKYVVK